MYNYQRLRDLREDKDLKQWQIAEILSMKQEQYQRYECGKREIPLHTLISLAEYYNVSLDYITGRTNDKGGLHCNYLDKEKRELISDWDLLSDHEKNSIKITIDAFLKNKKTMNGRKFG